MISISNETLKATFNTKGAELNSLVNQKNGNEYIWQANEAHWARHAPVLFPFVGKLKNDGYVVHGHEYSLGQHGFARDREFSILKHDQEVCSFSLKSDEKSLSVYPFQFELIITYKLDENRLLIQYEVWNHDKKEMYFSIGAHPAFNCPHTSGKSRSDYSLRFEKSETAEKHLLDDGLFNGKTQLMLDDNRTLPIADNLFDDDALVFKNLKSSSVTMNDGEKDMLQFDFKGFPYLGIWSKNRNSPFICIEPWFGLADHIDHNQELSSKEGIISLNSTEKFECEHAIKILN